MTGADIAAAARQALEDKHGEDPLVLDVRGTSSLTDYLVIVSGSSPPHLKALYNGVQAALKQAGGLHVYRRAGAPEGGWMVLDYVDAVIHIFDRKTRGYYAIESLWTEAKRLR
ncbi:MAG: ribosome silencing factor [Lentisphaerae bacterium]|nr:ribosome silencing factor [Lentisphaerota bacterium]